MFSLERFNSQCDNTILKFKTMLPITHVETGIAPSEAFSFCSMCDLYDIDLMIEGGVFKGFSTRIISKYLDCEMISVDRTIFENVKSELSHRVKFKKGDGTKVIPDLVKLNQNKKIGVLLDGPKGNMAIDLAEAIMKYDCVKFVGIHDMFKNIKYHSSSIQNGKEEIPRDRLSKSQYFKFFTDEDWFVDKWSWVDNGSGIVSLKEKIGSYFYTIGYIGK